MTARRANPWLAAGLGCVFVLLGLVLILSPTLGAGIYGITDLDPRGLAYVAALGFRDLAFGLYLVALSWLATRRALAAVLGITVLIPLGDLAIIGTMRGLESPGHLLLHAGSGAVMAGASAWLLRSSNREE